jgi:hypothetical protein
VVTGTLWLYNVSLCSCNLIPYVRFNKNEIISNMLCVLTAYVQDVPRVKVTTSGFNSRTDSE